MVLYKRTAYYYSKHDRRLILFISASQTFLLRVESKMFSLESRARIKLSWKVLVLKIITVRLQSVYKLPSITPCSWRYISHGFCKIVDVSCDYDSDILTDIHDILTVACISQSFSLK